MRRHAFAIIAGFFLVANLGLPVARGDNVSLNRPQLLQRINVFKKIVQLPGELVRLPGRISRVNKEAQERGGVIKIYRDRGLKDGLKMAKTGFDLTSSNQEKRTSAAFLDHVGQEEGPRSSGTALAKRSVDKGRHWFYGAIAGTKLTSMFTLATYSLYMGQAEMAQSTQFGAVPDYTIPAAIVTLATGAATLGVRHISKKYNRRAKQREMIGIAHELHQEGRLSEVLTKEAPAAAKSGKFIAALQKVTGAKEITSPTSKQIADGLLTAIADERKVAMKMGKTLLPHSFTNEKGEKKFGRTFNPEQIINVELYAGKAKNYLAKLDKLEQAVRQLSMVEQPDQGSRP